MDDGYLSEREHRAYERTAQACANITSELQWLLHAGASVGESLPSPLDEYWARLVSVTAAVRFDVDRALARHNALAQVE
jgi:hypothetical protein